MAVGWGSASAPSRPDRQRAAPVADREVFPAALGSRPRDTGLSGAMMSAMTSARTSPATVGAWALFALGGDGGRGGRRRLGCHRPRLRRRSRELRRHERADGVGVPGLRRAAGLAAAAQSDRLAVPRRRPRSRHHRGHDAVARAGRGRRLAATGAAAGGHRRRLRLALVDRAALAAGTAAVPRRPPAGTALALGGLGPGRDRAGVRAVAGRRSGAAPAAAPGDRPAAHPGCPRPARAAVDRGGGPHPRGVRGGGRGAGGPLPPRR